MPPTVSVVSVGTQGPPGPAGGVLSVGLAMPPEFTVTGSPVTTSGTLTVTWPGPWYIDPRHPAYGAKVDGRQVLDGAMTAGSAVLTSASGRFAPADVNKLISVDGAVAGGTGLVGNVLSYQSPTQVTLSAAATNSVTGASVIWGTDDHAAVQAAITAAQAAGGAVLFPPGVCVVSCPTGDLALSVTARVALLGVPGLSVLYCPTLLSPGPEGCGLIGLSTAGRDVTDVTLDGLTLMNNQSCTYNVAWAGLALIYLPNNANYYRRLRITRCQLVTPTRTGIAFGGYVDTLEIAGCVMPSMGETGFYLAGHAGNYYDVHDNWLGPTTVALAPGLSVRTVSQCRLHHNFIQGATDGGIFVRGPSVLDCDIEGNTVSGCTGSGNFGIGLDQGTRVTVRNNRVIGCNFGVTVDGFFAPIQDVTIEGNKVQGCASTSIYTQPQAGTSPTRVKILDNTVLDGAGHGIQTDSTLDYCVVRGNEVIYTAGGNGNVALRSLNPNVSGAFCLYQDNVYQGYTGNGGSGVQFFPTTTQVNNQSL